MKALTVSFLTLFSLTFAMPGIAFPELPFCPAGGPPGWFNRFTQNHDNNRWRYQNNHPTPQVFQPAYYPSQWYAPAYRPVNTQAPLTRENSYYRKQYR